MQWHACDPGSHQHAAFGKQEKRCHAEIAGARKRAALAPEQKVSKRPAPPGHAVDAAKHGFDLAGLGAEIPALDGGEDVALEHDLSPPTPVQYAHRPSLR